MNPSLAMNRSMVKLLILKDWYFNRWAMVGYVAAGLLSLVPIAVGGEGGFYAGSVLLISVVISIGIHITMISVVHERTEHTLAFVMTLPISFRQYTTAKILGNVSVFAAAWATLVVATVAVIASRAALPDGLIPFAIVVLGVLFAGYVLTLSVAIVSESLGWTVGAIVAANFLLQAAMYGASNAPGAQADLARDAIVWSKASLTMLGSEAGVIVLLLALTFYLQSRKTDFL